MKYSATFSNGKVATRTSDRTYTHAWLVVYTCCDRVREKTGFASSEVNADKAARALIPAASLANGYVTNVTQHVTGVSVS